MVNRIKFFRESLKSIKTLGTITPSSRFLANRMLKDINFSEVNILVELGPGNGAITKYILKKLPKNAKLICFEINKSFYWQLSKINNPQLQVINASAENLHKELIKLNISEVDHIISSLPLTIIPDKITDVILDECYDILKNGGSFIQFQYSLKYLKKIKKAFKQSISLDFEPLNVPPAFIYRCKK